VNLFQLGQVILSSGEVSDFKIDCDVLTEEDWACVAHLLAQRLPAFGTVEGIPRGGLPLARHLELLADPRSDRLLLADDVWTTGGSMERVRAGRKAIGTVLFARKPVADWVTPLFTMTMARKSVPPV
jgi:orotate phosphoribosyltransferase